MSNDTAKNSPITFPLPDTNSTIIGQTTNGVERRMKMLKYKMVTKDFMAEVKTNKTRTTFYSFQSGLNRYGRYLADDGMGDADCEYALSATALNAYKYSLGDRGLRGQSIKGALCPLKSLCSYLVRTKIMATEENPFAMMEMPGEQTPVRLLVSDDEVMGLLEAAERQHDPRKVAFAQLIVSTLVHTGARAQEVVCIQMGHLDMERETLEIRYGKGNKSRTLNPPPEWWIAVRAWLPIRDKMTCEHPYLFASRRRSHISDERLRAILEEVKAFGGMKGRDNIKPHSLRHWFASHMHANGGTIPMIQAALGHADPATTWKYIHNQAEGTKPMKELASFGPAGRGSAANAECQPAPRLAVVPESPTARREPRTANEYRS